MEGLREKKAPARNWSQRRARASATDHWLKQRRRGSRQEATENPKSRNEPDPQAEALPCPADFGGGGTSKERNGPQPQVGGRGKKAERRDRGRGENEELLSSSCCFQADDVDEEAGTKERRSEEGKKPGAEVRAEGPDDPSATTDGSVQKVQTTPGSLRDPLLAQNRARRPTRPC